MGTVRAYILSVIASSVICGCVQMLIDKKSPSFTLVRTLCGIYMAFVLIVPLQRIDFSVYGNYFSGFAEEANSAVTSGKNIALQEQTKRIKEQSQSYILDKAVSLGANITVEVTLSNHIPPIPSRITIKGAVSPYVKKVLTDYIKEQLGIPEEAQVWKQGAA